MPTIRASLPSVWTCSVLHEPISAEIKQHAEDVPGCSTTSGADAIVGESLIVVSGMQRSVKEPSLRRTNSKKDGHNGRRAPLLLLSAHILS